MGKNDQPKKLPTLADEDIVTVGRQKAQAIIRTGKNVTVSLALMATCAAVLPGCSDDKSCTDGDLSTSAPYDTGAFADPTDFGQQISQGDPAGAGDYCRDYD